MKKKYTRPVIESTRNLPILVQIRDIVLTILVWILYLYLMRDFFVFSRDVMSWTFHGFNDTETYDSFKIIGTIVSYIEVILVMEILFVVWSLYNLLRFGKKRRRRTPLDVSPEEIAKLYHLDPKDVNKWQKTRVMVMHHDKKGHLTKVLTSS